MRQKDGGKSSERENEGRKMKREKESVVCKCACSPMIKGSHGPTK